MYELKTAFSYLVPRRGQLSISVVGSIAVLVILAIAWLVLVFFSTTEGFERRWSEKIISVLGPMQIVPTPPYYSSPHCQLDLFSEKMNRSAQRLSSKLTSPSPSYSLYDDPALPPDLEQWYESHAQDQHPIFTISQKLHSEKVPWRTFESTVSHLCIPNLQSAPAQTLSQYTSLLGLSSIRKDEMDFLKDISPIEVETLLQMAYDQKVDILARDYVSAIDQIKVITTHKIEGKGQIIPSGTKATLSLCYENNQLIANFKTPSSLSIPLTQPLFTILSVSLHRPIVLLKNDSLAYVPGLGYPLLLSKHMRKQGVRLLDRGTFDVAGSGIGSDPLTIPFYVAGFFDSGILPIGSRLAITSARAVIAIQPELSPGGPIASSGLIIDLPRKDLASFEKKFHRSIESIAPTLFTTKRFDQHETTIELYHQLSSEKTLFRLISCIIIAVACSNIFSMLFILAHDRRKEIAILRALGATKKSIAAIFIIAGLGVGLLGSLLGSGLATVTLHYLPELLSLIGKMQGQELLQQTLYGEIGEQSLSLPTLLFTIFSISITSALAGGLAAVRACRINVSQALRG